MDEASEQIKENKGIISFSWCGENECGKDMEEKLRVDLLGIQTPSEEGETCVNCEKASRKDNING